jgi:transcriptional regulator with XRE-family HTH domain
LIKLRDNRHVTIADVSRNTGIQIAYLEYLEQGMFEKLPAEVYVRGFLRRYAEYLGVPDEPILRQYDRERGMSQSLSKDADKEDQNSMIRGAFQKIPSILITPRRITVSLFLLMASAGFIYVYSEYRSFISEPVLIVSEPMQEVTRTESTSSFIAGKTDPDSRIFINDQAILVDERGGFREKIDLQKGVNTVTIRSVNRFSKEAKRVYSIDASFEEARPEENIPVVETGNNVVVRTGKTPVWVLVFVDGEQKVSEVAKPDTRWEFMAKKSMTISAGDGREVYVTIDDGTETALSDKPGTIDGYTLDVAKGVFEKGESRTIE